MDDNILLRITSLNERWKKYHKEWDNASKSTTRIVAKSTSRNTTQENEATMERCSTWKNLYRFHEEQRELRFEMCDVLFFP